MHILLVEDDKIIASNICRKLEQQGYILTTVHTFEEAEYQIQNEDYDLLILDWMLPDGEGPDLISVLHQANKRSPTLLLTAKSDISDKLEAFQTGADDYLTKPFSFEELLARTKVLIRRGANLPPSPLINIQDLTLDTNRRELQLSGKQVILSPKEYSLLEFLCHHFNETVDRGQLIQHVWGESGDLFSNSLEVHIQRLRQKIVSSKKIQIKTIKNVGYLLCSK